MLSLADFLNDTVSGGLSFESAKCTIQALVFFNFYLTHLYSLPPQYCKGIIIILIICFRIILPQYRYVKRKIKIFSNYLYESSFSNSGRMYLVAERYITFISPYEYSLRASSSDAHFELSALSIE